MLIPNCQLFTDWWLTLIEDPNFYPLIRDINTTWSRARIFNKIWKLVRSRSNWELVRWNWEPTELRLAQPVMLCCRGSVWSQYQDIKSLECFICIIYLNLGHLSHLGSGKLCWGEDILLCAAVSVMVGSVWMLWTEQEEAWSCDQTQHSLTDFSVPTN